MPRFAVTITVDDLFYEIEAEDQDEAIMQAFELARNEDSSEFYLDCNECFELDQDYYSNLME